MIKVPASVRVRRWCWQLLVSQAKQCLEQTFKQTHQHWCCWWFLKGLQCSSSCSFFMFWYYNILIIASYIVKDHVRSWEGRWAGGGQWNEMNSQEETQVTRGRKSVLNPRQLHVFPVWALTCGHLPYWIGAWQSGSLKTKQQQHKNPTSCEFWNKGSKVELLNGIQSARLI